MRCKCLLAFCICVCLPSLLLSVPYGQLEWVTYLAGSDYDALFDVAVDSQGYVYVVGNTDSTDFPTTASSFWNYNSSGGFVAKLHPDGSTIAYLTILGGSLAALEVDQNGKVYVTGSAGDTPPVTSGAYDETHNGTVDIYVAVLAADGSLQYGTFLGDADSDYSHDIALDQSGNIYVYGYTDSTNFPTTPGAYDRTDHSQEDLFIAKFDPTLSSLLYSTYVGGNSEEWAFSLVVDDAWNAVFCGSTKSTDFPITPGAYDNTQAPTYDGFVGRLNSSGSSLLFCTFIGGPANASANKVAIDSSGLPLVVGNTMYGTFSVSPDAYDPSYNGDFDAHLCRLNATGTDKPYGTFFGGTNYESASALTVNSQGLIYMGGSTRSTDIPVTPDAYDDSFDGGGMYGDFYFAVFDASGTSLLYCSYLGDNVDQYQLSITTDTSGNLIFAGTSGIYSMGGDLWDGLVGKLNLACPSAADALWSLYD